MAIKKKTFFTIFRILGVFVVGMVCALFIALSQVNLETLRGNVLDILRNATGLPVEIDGTVSWKFSLRPRIELNQVRVPNAEWAKHKYAFSAEKVDVTIDLISLMRPRPTIQNVKVYDATICVEKNDAGQYSIYPFDSDKSDKDVADAPELAEQKQQPKYPFVDPGLGGIEIKNLVAHIFDSTYSVSGFDFRYMPKHDGREYAGWIKSRDDVFPFIVSLSEYNAERKIYPVRIAFSTGGEALIANVALEGTSRMPIDFIIKGDIPDIAAFGAALGRQWIDLPNMNVNLAGGLDRKKITLRKSLISIRGSEIGISGDYDWSKKIPSLNLNIEAGTISLMELFPDMYAHKWIRPNRQLHVFKGIPLPGLLLRRVNLNLRAEVQKLVVYRNLSIDDIDLSLNSANGTARLDLLAGIGGGGVRIGGDIDIGGDGHMYGRVGGVGRDISVGEILNQVGVDDFISDLPMNFETYVVADGKNLSEVMQTISGPVRAYSSGTGYAHSALVSYMYGTDFLTSLRHGIQDLFRSEKKYNQIKISCVAVNTKLRAGVAETQNGAAIETNAINIRLAGNMDLGGESMKLALTTVPVRGLKLSLTGNVMNSMEVSGNLAEPDVKISGAALAGKVASATGLGLLLAPFTGGLSVVAGAGVGLLAGDLLENWLSDPTPCETALKKGAPSQRDDPEWMNLPIEDLLESVMTKNKD